MDYTNKDPLSLFPLLGTEINRTVVQLLAPESPIIQVEKVVSKVTTVEDVPKHFSLWSIVNVTCNDTQYWRVWMQAAGESLCK